MVNLEAVIGLETHIQLNTHSKIFCACKADSWGDPPNGSKRIQASWLRRETPMVESACEG
jgi:Asp-tRNA(Asn)/Glu-tRNA(Gln) amidotransferase B subunit